MPALKSVAFTDWQGRFIYYLCGERRRLRFKGVLRENAQKAVLSDQIPRLFATVA